MKQILLTLLFSAAGTLAQQSLDRRPLPRQEIVDYAQNRKFVGASDNYEYEDYETQESFNSPDYLLAPRGSSSNSNRRSSSVLSSNNPNSLPPSRPNVFKPDCRSKVKTFPHEKQCDLYYYSTDCDDSQRLIKTCPNGLVYTGSGRNGLIGVCDYPHNVDCRGKNLNPPQSTEHCDWLYGIFGHETSCTRYWTCWNGTATEQFCVGGLLYNEETHACDWPQNVLGCQKHPLCKDDANGNVPLGKSCNRYWACQGGYPRLHRCPAMLVFDKQRKRCVAPPTADCDIPSTTPSPDHDEDDNNNDGGQPKRKGNRNGNGGRRRSQQQQNNNNGKSRPLPFDLPAGATLLSSPDDNN